MPDAASPRGRLAASWRMSQPRPEGEGIEEWLRSASRAATAGRATAPMDFTALVMSRIETHPGRSAPAPATAPIRERVRVVTATLVFSVFVLIGSVVTLVRFEPGIVFGALGALVSGLVTLATALRTLSDVAYAASNNTGLMLLVTAFFGASLLLWPQVARVTSRATREA